jgi:signal peptidase I
MLYLLILIPLSFTIPTIFAWGIFEKAGRQGWETLVPFYNLYVFLQIIKKPLWWYALLLFPFINVFVYMLMLVELAKCFNKFGLGEQFLAVVVPFIYLPVLGFSENEKFVDPDDRPEIKKGVVREWVDAIIFAVVAATIIRTFLIEAYTIPTSSMEKSMLVGDYLFVSKITYGPKVPNTPLAFPFVHHTMPFSSTAKSFVEWIKLPYYRFPGLGTVERNDPVVFNYPEGDTVSTVYQSNRSYYSLIRQYGRERVWNNSWEFGDIVIRPVDKRENYVKRCIGMPGDTLEIIDRQVYIGGKEAQNPDKIQFSYEVTTDGSMLNQRFLDRNDITDVIRTRIPGRFIMALTEEAKQAVENVAIVKSVEVSNMPRGEYLAECFPHDTRFNWNRDNYGPIYIPAKGVPIPLSLDNLPLYERLIVTYEGNTLEVKGDQIFINGQVAEEYIPAYDYYWMMGDNRHNSADSRFWGFVPEDHIVGTPEFVWLSLDENKSLFQGKIRWGRLFSVVR